MSLLRFEVQSDKQYKVCIKPEVFKIYESHGRLYREAKTEDEEYGIAKCIYQILSDNDIQLKDVKTDEKRYWKHVTHASFPYKQQS